MQCDRWVLLCCVFLCQFLSGGLVVEAYGNALRKQFSISQVQYEAVASLSSFGYYFHIIPGLLVDKFGGRALVVTGFILITISYVPLIISIHFIQYFQGQVVFLIFCFLVKALGHGFAHVGAVVIGMRSYPTRHHAKIILFADSVYGTGRIVFQTVFLTYFRHEHYFDEKNQDLKGFFVLTYIFGIVTFGACFFGLKEIPWVEDEETQQIVARSEDERSSSSSGFELMEAAAKRDDDDEEEENGSSGNDLKDWWVTLSKPNAQLLLWSSLLAISCVSALQKNLTTISRSLLLSQYDLLILEIPQAAGILLRVLVLSSSDYFGSHIYYRSLVFLICLVSCPLAMAALVINSSASIFYIIILLIVLQCTTVSVFCFMPVLYFNLYGRRHFGKLYGLPPFLGTVLGVVLNVQFGVFYQQHVITNGTDTNSCYGAKCYQQGSVLFLVVAVLSVLLAGGLTYRIKTKKD